MRELKLSTGKIKILILVTLICSLGYFLRIYNYASVPFPGESRDEYSFAWLGLSLLETGQPVATSGLPVYGHLYKYINVDNIYTNFPNPNPFPIDTPWFDHPPLFGLIPGGYAYLKNIRNFADASTAIIRKPMIWIGVINIGLVFLLTSLLFQKRAALFTSFIYATSPLIVISSRTVQAENLLISFFLLGLIFLKLSSRSNVYFWLAVSCAGLSSLIKVSGWSVALSLIFLTLIECDKFRLTKAGIIFGGTFIMFLFFPLYGLLYDINLFVKVWFTNSSRFFRDGFGGVYALITNTNISRGLFDGWVPFGWGGFLGLGFGKNSQKLWIIIPAVTYISVYLILGSEGYGWYKYPLFPFLAIAAGWLIDETFEHANIFTNLLLVALPGGMMLNRFIPSITLQNYIWLFRIGIIGLLLYLLLPLIFPKKVFIYRLMTITIFIGLIMLNIMTVQSITPDSWYKINWLNSFL